MKQKTIDLLLDCYIKERIPNADAILEESTNAFPMAKERSHTFSFAPTPPQYDVQGFGTDSANDVSSFVKGRSHTFSFAPTPPAYQELAPEGLEASCLESYDTADGINKKEEQIKCREVAKKLVKMADEFQDHYMNTSHNRSAHSFSEEHGNGYTPEERSALEKIYSGGPSQSVSRIASTLTSCFTRQTLQATIWYLSGQSDDVSQQFALTFELSARLVGVMGGKALGTIRTVVAEIFQDRAELEDL